MGPGGVREEGRTERDHNLGHFERFIAPVADDFAPILLLAQAGQRPGLRRFRYRQRPHEVAKVVGEGMELETHGVSGKGAARQPRPLDRPLPSLIYCSAGPRTGFLLTAEA